DSPARCAELLPEVPVGHAGTLRALVLAARAGKGAQHFEYTAPGAGGARHFEVRLALTEKHTIAVIVRDISAWSEERNRLLESETRFRIMANHAPVLLWMTGVDGE